MSNISADVMDSSSSNRQNQIHLIIHILEGYLHGSLICLQSLRIQNNHLTAVIDVFHNLFSGCKRVGITDDYR